MYIKYRFPTIEEIKETNITVERFKNKLKSTGLPSKEEMFFYTKKLGIFSSEMEREMTNLQEMDEIKYPKIKVFENKEEENKFLEECMVEIMSGERTINTLDLIKSMSKKEEPVTRLQELNRLKNTFTKHTYDGIADNIRTLKYLYYCTSRNGNKLWPNFQELLKQTNKLPVILIGNSLMDFLSGFNQTIIRKLARSSMWRTKWISATKTGAQLFNGNITEWDTNKVILAYYSNFYDSIYSGYEVPESFIIENDKFLDNWLEQKNREAKGQSGSSQTSDKNADGTRAVFNNVVIKKGNLKR
jgi:hypothetical protein